MDGAEALRAFNRFWTRRMGLLGPHLPGGSLTLAEARLLYEIARRPSPAAATDLARELGLDAAHVSRVLARFTERGWIRPEPSAEDARRRLLKLTPEGAAVFLPLDEASRAAAEATLATLPSPARARLLACLAEARLLLAPETGGEPVLRPPRPGDHGWVIARHGALYAEEFGWDSSFEGAVADIVAGILANPDRRREAAWIAEIAGVPVGSIFLVRRDEEVAKLRLLLVEPAARGRGLGARLVATCIAEARALGYRRLTLWTQDVLVAARRIYAAAGFQLVSAEPARPAFGRTLVSETWEMAL